LIAVQNLLISFFRSGLPVIGTALGVFYAVKKQEKGVKALGYVVGGWATGYATGSAVMYLFDRQSDTLPDQVGSLGSPQGQSAFEAYDPSNPTARPDSPPVGEPPPGPQPPRGTSQVIGAGGEVLSTSGPPAKTQHPSANVEGTLFTDAYGQGAR
jgi:hypothetical protein